MSALSLADRRRLVGICGLFGSAHDGERATAALMADAFIRDRGLSWADVLHAEPPPPIVIKSDRSWRDTASDCLFDHAQAVSEWEQQFLQDVLRRGYAPSPKQAGVLRRIAEKTGVPQW